MSPEERRLQTRLAAQTRWARTTPEQRRQATAKARAAFQEQLDQSPNPAAARAAHQTAMTLAALKKRKSA